ncbi:hypothetical protein [Paenibacillus sp. QZ-Y1]|uniref:hypothetical protein n=1 Tax=Paenibacillus sp. QZ-Y1 TaxID=3414511 RepID=UPI003F7B09D7
MKAKINGIEVEGTPEEIVDFNLKMEKHISQLVFDMKKYTPFPSPSIAPSPYELPLITSTINQSKCISVPIQKPTVIMEVDYGRDSSLIIVKDLNKRTSQTKKFDAAQNMDIKEMSLYVLTIALMRGVNEVHINTNGIAKALYEHLMSSEIKDRVIEFKHERFM